MDPASTTSPARMGEPTAIESTPTQTPRRQVAVRLLFGTVLAIDAVLKWLPGYRHTYLSGVQAAAQGQPSWLHWWFHGWISVQSHAPTLFAYLTAITETSLALVLLLGVARRVGYSIGILYMLLVWGVGEGFGGPYSSGATDIGTGIIYALLFAALLASARPARAERLSLDRLLVRRWTWWRLVAEPRSAARKREPSIAA
jgi:thiosulfate dehydrogenase (quinone) large subunit